MSANLIMGSEIGTPATPAFHIIVMWTVEPHPKAVFSGVWIAIFPLGIVQMFLGASGAYLVISPVYRAATPLLSEILDGYTRPFPSQDGHERNAGTVK
jgi:hypothetical protein